MATIEELIVKIEADNKDLKAALEESAKVTARSSKQMEDAISKFADNAGKATSNFDQIMNVFAGTTMANILVGAVDLGKQALGEFISLFKEGVAEAADYDQQLTRLANSMAANGKFTQEAMDSLRAYTQSMETLSGVDDAVIAKNLAVLSSMTRLSGEGLERAQTAALNLSAAMGIDLDSATKLIGKSAEGSTDAFKRYGITIEESADKNLTFANTLATIEKRFGSAAQGNMQTFSGAVTGLQNSFGNLFQALGDVIVKNPAIIAGMQELTKVISQLTGDAEKAGPGIAKSLAEGLGQFVAVAGTVYETFNKVFDFIIGGFALITTVVSDTAGALKTALSFGTNDEVAQNFNSTGQVFEQFKKQLSESSPITDAMANISGAITATANTMTSEFPKTTATIANTTEVVKQLTFAQQEQLKASQDFALQMATQSVSVQEGFTMQQESLRLALEGQLIDFNTYKEAKLASQMDMQAQEQAMIQTALEAGKITQEQARLAELQAQQKHNLDRIKLQQDLKKQEDQVNALRLGGYSTFFSGLASLSQSGNQRLAEIGKAAAIAGATIDAYRAIQNALANVPYPANIAAAAGIGIQAFANVSKIAGVGLANGIDSVPGVGSKDSFPAVLAPGERVVPSETNQDLTRFLENQQNNQAPVTVNVTFTGPVWGNKAEAGSEIVEAINEAIARGMSLRLLST